VQKLLISESECVRNRSAGSAGRELTAHPDPLAGFMGKTGKEEGRGREREKVNGEREGEWQRKCKVGKAGIEGEEMR